jgi:hypothetical protein
VGFETGVLKGFGAGSVDADTQRTFIAGELPGRPGGTFAGPMATESEGEKNESLNQSR